MAKSNNNFNYKDGEKLSVNLKDHFDKQIELHREASDAITNLLEEKIEHHLEICNTKINALEDKIQLNLKLNDVALDKAETKLDLHLHSLNETYSFIKEQNAKTLTIRDYETRHQDIQRQIIELKDMANTHLTSKDFELKHELIQQKISVLELDKAKLEGKASAVSVYFSYFLAIIAIITSFIGVFHGIK